MAIHATGDIKKFQIVEGSLLLTVVPIAYVLLKFFAISSEMVFVVYLIIETFVQFVRVWIVYPRIRLSRKLYFTEVLWPISRLVLVLLAAGYGIMFYRVDSFSSLVVSVCLCLLSSVVAIGLVGLRKNERAFILSKLKTSRVSSKKP